MDGKGDRIAGNALIAAAALIVLMMAHHPTGTGGGMGQFVHGVLIVLVGVTIYGLAHLALRRGIARPDVLAGAVAYAIGAMGSIGAGTINGFVVPALAAHEGLDRGPFVFAWEANQALAWLGVIATGAAFALWSLGLVRANGWPRAIGVLGLVAGAAPVALLASGAVRMNVTGAILVYSTHALWIAAAGLWLRNGRFEADRARLV